MGYRDCPLSPAHGVALADRTCNWCGRPCEGRRRTWCSDGCVTEWRRLHEWPGARAAALERDGRRCVRCGHPGNDWPDVAVALVAAGLAPLYLSTGWDRVNLATYLQEGDEATRLGAVLALVGLHRGARWAGQTCRIAGTAWGCGPTLARLAAADPLVQAWAGWCRRQQLEVNHIEPRRGAGYGSGCWNHLDNLETLCHPCHVVTTRRQQGHRSAAERALVDAVAALCAPTAQLGLGI